MLAQVAFFLVYVKCNKNIEFKKASKINKLSLKNLLLCILIGVIGVFALNPISNCLYSLFETIGLRGAAVMPFEPDGAFTYITAVLLFALVPAVVEELIFRGVILHGFRKFGFWQAIIFSSILFALIHANIQQFAYTFIFGAVLAYLVLKTGSLLASMIIHFIANFASITFYNFNIFAFEFEMNVVYWLVAIVLLVLFVLMVYYLGKRMKSDDKTIDKQRIYEELAKIEVRGENGEEMPKEKKVSYIINCYKKGQVLDCKANVEEVKKLSQLLSSLDLNEEQKNDNRYLLRFGIMLSIIIFIMQTLLIV